MSVTDTNISFSYLDLKRQPSFPFCLPARVTFVHAFGPALSPCQPGFPIRVTTCTWRELIYLGSRPALYVFWATYARSPYCEEEIVRGAHEIEGKREKKH